MKKIALFFLLFAFVKINATTPLFGYIKDVPRGDVLNVRALPTYHSKKVGTLRNGEHIKVLSCKRKRSSKWCKIAPLKNETYRNFYKRGLVNARYLQGYNKGYVAIKGKKDCYYSLGCLHGKCKVVIDTKGDLRAIQKLITKNIPRRNLLPLSAYNASADNSLCTIDSAIFDYLNDHPGEFVYPKEVARSFFEFLEFNDATNLKRYIHPTQGVLISYYPTFARGYKHFSPKSFEQFFKNNTKIYWGESQGKGEKIYLSLKEYFKLFKTQPKWVIQKANPKRFDFPSKKVEAIEIKTFNPQSKTKEYDWKSLVIFMKKFHGKYYYCRVAL